MKLSARRILLPVGLAAMIAVAAGAPAGAETGATVGQCSADNPVLKGNSVITPDGQANYHCRSTLSGPSPGGGAFVIQCDGILWYTGGNAVFTPNGIGNFHCTPESSP